MNRAFLEAYGLDKETVDAIMAEHGRSIEKQKWYDVKKLDQKN